MEDKASQLPYLLGLTRLNGFGPVKISAILEQYPDLRVLFDSTGRSRILESTLDWDGIEKDLKWAEGKNCHIVSLYDKEYPAILKEIPSAPPILFVRGNLKLLARPQIAIVGSRNPTPLGIENAFSFSRHFSEVGFTVTSGLAVGIDAAAHRGALMGEGGTIAVLANGLDRIYPATHRDLAHEISEKGILVSEFPLGTPPIDSQFPRRNRIISGLSVGTLVVEAAIKSGSLITAKLALEQGREVFAIPGSIHSSLSKGCHALIRQGAKLVESAEHVLEELEHLIKFVSPPKGTRIQGDLLVQCQPLSPQQEKLLEGVGYEGTSVDKIVERTGLTVGLVSSMLLELELLGYVVSVPGGVARVLKL